MAPTTRRARRAFAELPTDVLFDVFLQLSATELCRLRVVCRAWRSLTCDPHFIRAHAARHQRDDPLLVASFLLSGPSESEEGMLIDIIDLSGKTVKRVASATDYGQVLCPRLGLVFVGSDNTCRVLDPASANARVPVAPRFRLPALPAPSHRGRGSRRRRLLKAQAATSFAFGRVAATGEHKVLRIFHRLKDDDTHLFELLTLGGDRARWRDMPSPDMFVCPDSSTVVDGVVYFLRSNAVYNGLVAGLPGAGIAVPPADCVASFDLEREEWRKRLQGPISMGYDDGEDSDDVDEHNPLNHRWCQFALAELKGSLVLVHYLYVTDLWILTDFERGVWVKEYSIVVNDIRPPYMHLLKPLLVLGDGRLLAATSPRTETRLYTTPEPTPGRGSSRDLLLFRQLVSMQAVSWVYKMHGDMLQYIY